MLIYAVKQMTALEIGIRQRKTTETRIFRTLAYTPIFVKSQTGV